MMPLRVINRVVLPRGGGEIQTALLYSPTLVDFQKVKEGSQKHCREYCDGYRVSCFTDGEMQMGKGTLSRQSSKKDGKPGHSLLTFSERALCIEAQWLERRNKMRKQDSSAWLF